MNTVYFCEPSESMRNSIAAFFRDTAEFDVKLCMDAESYKKLAADKTPDCLVIDLETDGIREIFSSFGAERPKIALSSRRMGDEIEGTLAYFPHDTVFYKPYSLNDVKAGLLNLLSSITGERVKFYGGKSVDERLSNIFIRAGIPPHIKGYQYLRMAVKLAINQPDIVNSITKKLYPTVAEYFDTTASKVERAIRHAIEVAWSRGKIENINAIFGIKIYSKGDKPTNGELIALVADKMVIEMMPE